MYIYIELEALVANPVIPLYILLQFTIDFLIQVSSFSLNEQGG